ncbi:hypothetical protein [Bacteroides congonensis]
MKNFILWCKEAKYNIILTLVPVFLPFIIDIIMKAVDTKFTFQLSDAFFVYLLQTFFILMTLLALTNNKKRTYKDLSQQGHIMDYLRRECQIRDESEQSLVLAYNIVKKTTNQFYFAWLAIWLVWLIYYLGNLIFESIDFFAIDKMIDDLTFYKIHDLFNNTFDFISSMLLYAIYLILNDVTVSRSRQHEQFAGIRIGVILLVIMFAVFCSLSLLSLSFLYYQDYKNIQICISVFLGFFATFSFVLTLGKLNSNYLQIPRLFLYILYSYAIIQAYEPMIKYMHFLEVDNGIKIAFLYFTLLGKVALMLSLTWIVHGGRFIFFVIYKSQSLTETPRMLNKFNKYISNIDD